MNSMLYGCSHALGLLHARQRYINDVTLVCDTDKHNREDEFQENTSDFRGTVLLLLLLPLSIISHTHAINRSHTHTHTHVSWPSRHCHHQPHPYHRRDVIVLLVLPLLCHRHAHALFD
jgi:hypothetical protein